MSLDLPIQPIPASLNLIKAKIKGPRKRSCIESLPVGDFYRIVNPDRKKFQVPKAPRNLQTILMRLRHNSYKFCAHRCLNTCGRCDRKFSTGHYLISCPATFLKFNDLRGLLKEEEHAMGDDRQAATILHRIAGTDHRALLNGVVSCPPRFYCDIHGEPLGKFHHLAFMPP